ncbi:HAD family hydrolase [Zongyangia hominis]|uniref:HAD family phosphatase n=1 Tax=Zongyangia hominis TaxID=2763677 RepID=A0A926EDN5_9FIRM|nr:HAD family phosphatase [Zongyangia hominis]MBC8570499.1 HAD family phosphatase [Zongyangia hominis]
MKGAIFDMDGTLLDSMGAWDRVVPLFLKKHGVADPGDINIAIAAMTFVDGAQYTVDRFSLPMTAADVMKGLNDLMLWEYTHTVQLKPGVRDYLEKLREEGVALCVATATDRALALPALERQGILDLFQFVVSVEEVGVGKERPEIFLECARRLALPAEECCVYEDALHSIQAARGAGFATCGVADGGSAAVDAGEIERLSTFYITSFEELL